MQHLCTMIRILPQQFYENPEIHKLMVDGLSCIVHKKVDESVYQKEGFVSTHALTIVLNGTLKAEHESGATTLVKKDQMIFLPKGLHTISDIISNDRPFEAMVFFFDEKVIQDFVSTLAVNGCKDKCLPHFLLETTPEIQSFTKNLMSVYGKKGHTHHKMTPFKLFELLHLISISDQGECFKNGLTSLNNKERRSLKSFMSANFSKPLSVEDYAYLTGRSLSSFRRDFIVQFGISPKQWLIEKRMEKAHQLLSKNHTTVGEVAFESGYDNMSHFIKAFHKMYGMPPKQFLIQQRRAVLV